MKLIILGSGTSVPLADRASPSLAIFIEDQFLLLDIGPGAVRQLAIAGLKYQDIDYIGISHFHPDHTADLIHFFFATRYPPILDKRKPFTIIAPEGFNRFLNLLKKPYGSWLDLPAGLMNIVELRVDKNDKEEFDKFTIRSAPVNHTPQSIGFRIEDNSGRTVVYSADTGYCEDIVALARGADLLILESSFPDGEAMAGHLTPSEAGNIATQSGAKGLVLTHFYPECLRTDAEAQCRKTYQGDLLLATDLMSLSIE
ncbi:MAG: MBL fold metallo-hydrolase [Deltaproteobacteria bacterium]|nr:MBL fold metallo-hydrolase [Deltaproteobacteria bacterium]